MSYSSPFGGDLVEEPGVEIRRPFSNEPRRESYQSTAAASAVITGMDNTSILVNGQSSTGTVNSNFTGSTTRHGDKTPLIQDNLLRSLSGGFTPITAGRSDGLSSFSGVFAPVFLSMMSVLLYLRMGFVIGQAGILITIAQLLISYAIVSLTVLSLCAVSTNGAIEGGGVYYMISRALGPEFGGSIGILFFLANVFSCGLSIAGFRESLISNFGPGGATADGVIPDGGGYWTAFGYDFLSSLLILGVSLVGASLFAKTSLVLLGTVAATYVTFLLSLMIKNYTIPVAIPGDNRFVYKPDENGTIPNGTIYFDYTGVRGSTFRENIYANFSIDYTTGHNSSFAIVFAVVFCGVTGIMAGANMSGELKNPAHSIPRGTLMAVATTFVVYMLTSFLLAASCTRKLLLNDYTVMQNINIVPAFIVIGIFATTLFPALSALIGASRVLSRLAEDKLFGYALYPATLTYCRGNPIGSVLITWILVVLVLLIGALNKIAEISAIFFLMSYAGVNLACLGLELASAPNFRPMFKYFSWHTAFLGFAGCVAMMFVVDPVFAGVAIILLLLLLITLHYMAPMASWGSISQALIFHQVRKYLLLLDSRKEHVKFWRPQILLLVSNPRNCTPLLDLVNDLKKSGLYVIGHVKKGKMDNLTMDPISEEIPFWLGLVDYLNLKAFVELTMAPAIRDGVAHLIRMAGIGAMKPNTVILGFHDSESAENTFERSELWKSIKFAKLERAEIQEFFEEMRENFRQLNGVEYVQIIHDALRMNKNVCLARGFAKFDKEAIFRASRNTPQYIDVWPVDITRPNSQTWGFDNSCLFLLQLACILNMVNRWQRRTTVRVFLVVTSNQDIRHRELQLKDLLNCLRIQAKSMMVPWDHVLIHVNDSINSEDRERPVDFASMPEDYVRALNETIRRYSNSSAVCFINAPPPPPQEAKFDRYLEYLELLSHGLPPTMLVHGISSVISTAL